VQLTGEQIEEFAQALLSAFPSYSDLEQMVLFKLDKNLEDIAGRGRLQVVATDLIKEYNKQSDAASLLRAARASNSGNALLRQFEERFNASSSQRGAANSQPGSSAPSQRTSVFISYSHKDRVWLDRFKTAFAPAVRTDRVKVWDDTQIPVGSRWMDEIKAALQSARIALLLVTPDFLASDFIANEELRNFLIASGQGGLKIYWVAVRDSLFQVSELGSYQAANSPDRPLAGLKKADQDSEINRICRMIIAEVNAP